MNVSKRISLLKLTLLSLLAAGGIAEGQEAPVDFAREILPVLSDKCFVCHGPDSASQSDLRLDSLESATEDRGGYRAIDPENPADSELLARINSEDDPMPPSDAEKQLTAREKQLLQHWVMQGGNYAQHWSFVTPVKHQPYDNLTHAIDSLVGERLQREGIDFAPEADRAVLGRRVSLILTGLPLEPDQLQRYLADESENAYEKLVDELLTSPRFGEHQARYWLDAVRYGDTHGLHLDNRRGIYPYRDWVVRSFNENLPLDDFITWQIAGDLLPDPTLDQLVATGFVRLNPSTGEGGAISEEFQMKNNFDRVETLGTVFLGMSLTCARCHTHKYDPVEQTEYYRLMAFFNNTAEPALDGNSYTYGPTVRVPADQMAWSQWQHLRDQIDRLMSSLQIANVNMDEVVAHAKARTSEKKESEEEPENKTDDIWDPLATKGSWEQCSQREQLRMLASEEGPLAELGLREQASQLLQELTTAEESFTTTLVAKELDKPRETRLLKRGEYDLPDGDPLVPGVLNILTPLPDEAPRNRLGLAQWLTAPDHPLVARVLVNRIWQRTFGAGLVRTPEEFGLQGQQPTHPELLDWVAVELIESGWDLKKMLRAMVTSRTFKQSSAWRDDIDDPENILLARGASYRLDAEVLRDIGLWASGLLDPQMGGEGVKPYQPPGMWAALAHPASNTKKYERDQGERLYRRSLYVYWKRTSPHPMMTLFDAPDRESSCVRRGRTNTPLQSLGLLNETQRMEMGRGLAARLIRSSDDPQQRINLMFQLVAGREASESEIDLCVKLVDQMQHRYSEAPQDAEALLTVGDAPRDETIESVEHATWTQLAITMLASDLAIVLY